jgi:hypothetical protein
MRARVFWLIVFWVWGFLGLVVEGSFLIGPLQEASPGIPRIASELVWIGGMVLFGLSALMCRPPD